jgi:hypothetical protein
MPPPKQPAPTQPPPGPVIEEKKPHKIEKMHRQEEEAAAPSSVAFNLPGIIGVQEGSWRGTDHLLNLTNNIPIEVDIMVGEDIKLPFTESDVREHIAKTLVAAGIKSDGHGSGSPLPYLHFLIMAQKCNEEVAVFIQARLFEKVKLERVALSNEVHFQAITWEDENLLVVGTSHLKKDVFTQIDEMGGYFVQRYNFFEKETNRMKSK